MIVARHGRATRLHWAGDSCCSRALHRGDGVRNCVTHHAKPEAAAVLVEPPFQMLAFGIPPLVDKGKPGRVRFGLRICGTALPSIAAINEFVFVASATVRAADEQHVDTPLS